MPLMVYHGAVKANNNSLGNAAIGLWHVAIIMETESTLRHD